MSLPAGPHRSSAGAGQVTTTAGTISVAGQTITVSSLSRNAGQTAVITYAGGIATTTTGCGQLDDASRSPPPAAR